ncbi:MAG: hypothetical protein Q9195_005585 [Heterodermia aff. obscurata]
MRSPRRSPTRSPTPLPKWRPRRTLIDLYNEKDRTRWYWKAAATLSAWMIMIAIHSGPSPHWTASSIAAIALSTISSLAYTVLYLLTYRKVYIVRSRDAMHRHNTDGESLLPEDEMQRQQLLRLLLQRDGKKVSSELSRSTYRIDLPTEMRRTETHLSAPQNVYGGRDVYDSRGENHRSRSVPNVPLLDPTVYPIPHQTPTPTVQVQEPTDDPTAFPQFSNHPPPPEPSFPQYPQPLLPSEYTPHHPNDLGIEGLVNTHPRQGGPSFPIEKQEQLTRELSLRHPAERPDYHFPDDPQQSPRLAPFRQQSVEELNRLSRESRRVEIEMDVRGRKREGAGSSRAELDVQGVEITPRIVRVGTDGWDRD